MAGKAYSVIHKSYAVKSQGLRTVHIHVAQLQLQPWTNKPDSCQPQIIIYYDLLSIIYYVSRSIQTSVNTGDAIFSNNRIKFLSISSLPGCQKKTKKKQFSCFNNSCQLHWRIVYTDKTANNNCHGTGRDHQLMGHLGRDYSLTGLARSVLWGFCYLHLIGISGPGWYV